MSSEIIEDVNLTEEEKEYRDLIRRGDDFFRIELFKSSREKYEEALKLKPSDEYAQNRIIECNNLIKRDTRRILMVLPFVIAFVYFIVAYKCC